MSALDFAGWHMIEAAATTRNSPVIASDAPASRGDPLLSGPAAVAAGYAMVSVLMLFTAWWTDWMRMGREQR